MYNILPEESPNAKVVLNGHHHNIFMGREGQSIIGRCPTHYQSASMDPHHQLDKSITKFADHSFSAESLLSVLLGSWVIESRLGNTVNVVWFGHQPLGFAHYGCHANYTNAQQSYNMYLSISTSLSSCPECNVTQYSLYFSFLQFSQNSPTEDIIIGTAQR